MAVNWVGLEKAGKIRIVIALALALRGKSISEIARETGIPTSSLYSIRKHGLTHIGTNRAEQPRNGSDRSQVPHSSRVVCERVGILTF
jgi:transposase-like protein